MTIRSFDVSFSDDPQNSDDALRESHRLPQSTLDALLANIAILDEHATIIAVNAAWRFAEANCYIGAAYGTNYLEVCDSRSRGGCWESCGCGTAPCKRMDIPVISVFAGQAANALENARAVRAG
jgi:hypothetical protein